jgi:hypothetical protein
MDDTLMRLVIWIAMANAKLDEQAQKIAELEAKLAEAKG